MKLFYNVALLFFVSMIILELFKVETKAAKKCGKKGANGKKKGFRMKNGKWKDTNCKVYPTFCRPMPAPPPKVWGPWANSVPCYKISVKKIGKVKKKQDA